MAEEAARRGRLLARPGVPVERGALGEHHLGSQEQHEGVLYVPEGYEHSRPVTLVVLLHGAGGNGAHGVQLLMDYADEWGLILLAPTSRGRTWDLLLDGYGPDVLLIDRLLGEVFRHYAIAPERLAIGGFSDGASYALSLGLANGDLFTHIVAFSPGFMAPAERHGAPPVYVAHGTQDNVLPITRCSRRLVPVLRRAGYAVTYREFPGGHTVPPAIAREAVDWLTAEGEGVREATQ